MKHNRLKQFFQDFYLALILLFLYIPIVTMIVLSFNNTKSRTVWGGFTTRWYTQMFQDSAIMNALNNTLLIAFARPVRKSFGRVRRGLRSARSLQRFDAELVVHHRRAFELDARLKVSNFLGC